MKPVRIKYACGKCGCAYDGQKAAETCCRKPRPSTMRRGLCKHCYRELPDGGSVCSTCWAKGKR